MKGRKTSYFFALNRVIILSRSWLLLIEDISPLEIKNNPKDILPKMHGALIKNEQDVQLFEKLVFMSRGKD